MTLNFIFYIVINLNNKKRLIMSLTNNLISSSNYTYTSDLDEKSPSEKIKGIQKRKYHDCFPKGPNLRDPLAKSYSAKYKKPSKNTSPLPSQPVPSVNTNSADQNSNKIIVDEILKLVDAVLAIEKK